MIGLSKYYIVELEGSEVDVSKGYYYANGVKIFLPPKQEFEFGRVPTVAKVKAVTQKNIFGLNVGDDVLIHHYVNENLITDKESPLRFVEEFNPKNPTVNQIYGVIKDKSLIMLKSNIVVDRIDRDLPKIEGFTYPENFKHKEQQAIVRYSNKKNGLKVGDTISLFKNNFQPIKFLGEKTYLVDVDLSVPFVYRGDDMELLPNWVLLKPHVDNSGFEKKGSLHIPSKRLEGRYHATIVQLPKDYEGELEEGVNVIFLRNENFKVEVNEEDLYFANFGERYSQILAYY